jgi:putative CocE/NonD family hydrolase
VPLAKFYAEHGYVFVIQDTRGRGDSDGTFNFFFSEGKDGYDTIEWLAAQPWSNGKVGMIGVSYLGTVQWLAAREHPPHLVCIVPTAPAGRYFNEIPYYGGAFASAWALSWLNGTSDLISSAERRIDTSDCHSTPANESPPITSSRLATDPHRRT